jgi:hypothetical protein
MRPIHTLVTIARLDPRETGVGTKMIKLLRGLGLATLGVVALTASAAAQSYPPPGYPPPGYPPYPAQTRPAPTYPAQGAPGQPAAASNPVCVRLEGQLATIDRSASDPARADQIQHLQDAIAKQQADLDRTIAQAHKVGCEGQGFFSLFSGLSPQCSPLTSQIQRMRGDLDRTMSDLEQLKSGSTDREGQRRAVIGQLAQNNCGQQYTAAARAAGPQGFFDALLGGGTILSPAGDGAPAGTYRTVCVRTCDGYYFPISYSTVPSRFADDEHACQRLCPAAEATLYSYRNPGEEMEQAVSISGQLYTALPNAFHYRKEVVSTCSCRRPGESWADALRNADDSSTLETGDIVVTDKNAKALSQVPPSPPGKLPPKGASGQPAANAAPPASAAPDPGAANASADAKNRKVRTVGPPFVSSQ